MRLLIVEDEPLVAKKLHKLVLDLDPSSEVIEITNSVQSTVEWLQRNTAPDCILMDIELADGQSFNIFKEVEVTSPVIFITAYDEYALKAFKVNSVDYLLKPVKAEELEKALQKLQQLKTSAGASKPQPDIDELLKALNKFSPVKSYRDRFLIKVGQKSISVPVHDIAYFFTGHSINYLLTSDNKKLVVDYTLDEIEQALDPKYFFRANRQVVLSSKAVVAVHPWFNGKLKVEVIPASQEHVVISREKAAEFKSWLGE